MTLWRDLGTDIGNFLGRPEFIVGSLVLVSASVGVAWLARRTGRSTRGLVPLSLGLGSVLLVLGFTVVRDGFPRALHPSTLVHLPALNWPHLSDDPWSSSQFVLNVALFVPAGAIWTVLTRQPWRVFGRLVLFGLAIEWVQPLLGAGVKDWEDIVTNTLGAAIGTAVAALVVRCARRASPTWPARTRVLAALGTVVAIGVLTWGAVAVASARQTRALSAARAAFERTTLAEIRVRLADDPESVWDVGPRRSDGSSDGAGGLVVRYPTPFLSIHRCVYVRWTQDAVRFERHSGDDCTMLIG